MGVVGGSSLLFTIHHLDGGDSWGDDATLMEALLMGVTVGIAGAGPVVLLAQWRQGRTFSLRLGEWLWLIPLPLYLVTLAGTRRILVDVPDFIHCLGFGWWVSVQGMAALFAMFHLLWTDRLGCVSCFLVGAMVFVNLLIHPLAI